MKDAKRQFGTLAIAAALLLAAAVMALFSVFSYANGTWQEVEGLMLDAIVRRADNQAEHLRLPLQSRLRHLEALAAYLDRQSMEEEALREILQASAQTQGFVCLARADASGAALCSDGQRHDFSGLPFLEAARDGESGIYASGDSQNDSVLLCAALDDGGALVARVPAEALAGVFLESASDSLLVTPEGRIVASSSDEMQAHVGRTLSDLLGTNALDADLAQGRRAVYRLTSDALDVYAACAPLRLGGWQVVCVVPVDEARHSYAFMYDAAHLLEIRLALCGAVVLAVAVWLMQSKNRQTRAEKLRLEWIEERYRVLAEDSNEVFWEYDLSENRLRMGKNFQRLCQRDGDDTMDAFLQGVHPDDRARLENVWRVLSDGASAETRASTDVRLRVGGPESERYLWCRMRMSVLMDARRHRRLALGKLTDISRDRLNAERLEKRARTDALTGLLNRAGLEEAVEARLRVEGEKPCAVVMVDIDDFKAVNDNYGHGVGDEVLRALADFLRGHFRGTDIIGRLGGDEFMALMDGVDSPEKLTQALTRCRQAMTKLRVGDLQVRCSAGAALFPSAGKTFEALYKHTDAALYDAKRAGKSCYMIYKGPTDAGREP